jgi:phosphoribosyl-AMP cyclohydrolase
MTASNISRIPCPTISSPRAVDLADLKFDDRGLLPAIVQDVNTNSVLMLAYVDEEARC